MTDERAQLLSDFVAWTSEHITGDLLAQLLDLNLVVAKRIERGDPVTSPGIPPGYPKPDELVTDDCIRP